MTTSKAPPQKRRHRSGPGFTLPGFAEYYGLPIGTIRRAVKNGEITTVAFGGRNLITPSEAERICRLFSLKARDGPESDS